MQISTKGKYAMEALLYLAVYSENKPVSIKQISEAMKISEKYLAQIFFTLRKMKILTTTRGKKGGYLILPDQDKLTAGDIIRAVEGDIIPVSCVNDPDSCSSKVKDICVTRDLWIKVTDSILNILDNITIEELKNNYNEMQKH